MDVARFVEERRPDWERLDRLLRLAGRGLGRLGKVDLRELGALYRQAASDLARAQAAAAGPELVEYLTTLVVRGHGIIYRPERARWAGLAAFFAREFPRLVRQEWRPILLGVAAFLLPVLWCYAMAALDPQFIEAVAPPGLRERLEKGELWVYRINPIRPLESSRIMTNNLAVTFTYFALGITFGAGTLLALLSFGVHFGSLSVIVAQTRMAREFWAFVAPHGALEIPAVFFAAAAGFILGGALLFPGDLRRVDALTARGRVAVKLVFGCVPMLVIAGIIEAFFSPLPPSVLPERAKALAGAALFALFLVYILRAGTAPTKKQRAMSYEQ
jgi:uncharacterized membrane protein SpoIIM required for sporulation